MFDNFGVYCDDFDDDDLFYEADDDHLDHTNVCACDSPFCLLLFAGSADKTVRLWDVSTQREVAVLEGHTKGVTSVAFDGSGKYIASGGASSMTS